MINPNVILGEGIDEDQFDDLLDDIIETVRQYLFKALKKEGFADIQNELQVLHMDPMDRERGEYVMMPSYIRIAGVPKKMEMSLDGVITILADDPVVKGAYYLSIGDNRIDYDTVFEFKLTFNKDYTKIVKHKFFYN